MSIIYFLIPISLLLVAFAIWSFFWAIKNKQFDDLESPARQILLDDDSKPPQR